MLHVRAAGSVLFDLSVPGLVKQYFLLNHFDHLDLHIFFFPEKPWPRVLEPMKKRRRHVICKLCCSSGKLETTGHFR